MVEKEIKTRKNIFMKTKTIRLNHFLSSCGVCSRRKAEEIIRHKIVMVNGKRVRDPALKIHPAIDNVIWNGKSIKYSKKKWYIAFNKPVKVLTSMSDPKNRLCVADFLKNFKKGQIEFFQ